MKKNILLTLWLALPITIVCLLMVWIFVSLDKDKLMGDVPAVGAGAGDTGNANAIGELLAGNDADAISLANRAKREGVAVDPREWPGGVELMIHFVRVGKAQQDFAIEVHQGKAIETVQVRSDSIVDEYYSVVLKKEQTSGAVFRLHGNSEWESVDKQVPPAELQPLDPFPAILGGQFQPEASP
jgi:hypothetical protein